MNNKINDLDLMEVYKGDTIGRKYKKPIITKDTRIRTEPARELRTIDLNCRMDKTEFRRLDKDTQREYIFYLHKTYGATLIEIGKMLGYSNNSIFGVTKRLKIVGKFGNGNKKKTEAQKTAWEKFLNSEEKAIEIPPPCERARNYSQQPKLWIYRDILCFRTRRNNFENNKRRYALQGAY